MKKWLMLLAAGVLFLGGCTTEYEMGDIEQFVTKELKIKNSTVYLNTREVEGTDGYLDEVWTVLDETNNVKFHVINDYRWGMETLCNSLKTDYNQAVLKKIEKDLSKFDFLTVKLSQNEAMLYSAEILGRYKNKEELISCCEELKKLRQVFADLGYPDLSILYKLEYHNPLRNSIPNWVMDDGDYQSYTDKGINQNKILKNFLKTALDYRFDEIDSFTEKEIAETAKYYKINVGICRTKRDEMGNLSEDEIEYYNDIVSHNHYDVTYGTLYEILLREGFEPIGNAWHYQFTGSQGDVYEISYEFSDYIYEDNEIGYYYLKNKEPIKMDYYYRNYFSFEDVQKMTGLELVTEK